MISSLFKPAWKSKSPDKRISALASLDMQNPEEAEIINSLCSDPDASVCKAAINKLSDLSRVQQLSQNHAESSVREHCNQRTIALIADPDFSKTDVDALLKNTPELAAAITIHALDGDTRLKAVDTLSAAQRLEVLSHTSFTDVRQQIAEQLSELDDLEAARKALRGKDKNAERILKTRIDAIHLEQRLQSEHEMQVAKLIEEADYLSTHDWLPEFKARVIANTTLWEKLERPIADTDAQRYQASHQIMQQRVDQQTQIDNAHAAQKKHLGELEVQLKQTASAALADAVTQCDALNERINKARLEWIELKTQAAPEDAEEQRHQHCLQTLEGALNLLQAAASFTESGNTKTINKALERFQWPSSFGEFQAASDLRNHLDERREADAKAAKEKQERLSKLHKQVSSISRLAKAGHLGRAKHTHDKVAKAVDDFSGGDRQRLHDRLSEAAATLKKMDDWKNFATEPKYKELIESMEALIDSKLSPDNRAGKIKALQTEWKSLGYSAVSDEYWPRFKEAADKAYAPCADHFAKRQEDRQGNLQNRQRFVDEMRQLLEQTNWDDNPDYKAAQDQARKINDGYTAIKDVERGAGNKQWKAYCKVRDAVYEKLDVAYDANLAAKQRLIDQAQTLADSDAHEDNLGKLQLLQTRWKQVGITRRKDDQKAWKQFKALGDQVFEKIQALRQEKRSENDQLLDAYRELINRIAALAKSAQEIAPTDHQFSELQSAYEALPALPESLPEKLRRSIARDYQQACQRLEDSRRRIIKRQRRTELDALRQKAELCSALENLDAGDSDERDRLHAQWQLIELHDHDLNRRIDARWANADKPADRSKIGADRRLFCIRLEIATGKDSPSEDRSLRTQYQLEQMNQSGLGQAAVNIAGDLEQMEVEWLCMAGAESDEQKRLDSRFYGILKN